MYIGGVYILANNSGRSIAIREGVRKREKKKGECLRIEGRVKELESQCCCLQ